MCKKEKMILNSNDILTTANAVINYYLKIAQNASQIIDNKIIKPLFRIKSFIEITYMILIYSNDSVSLDFENFKSKFDLEAEQVYEYISGILSDNCLSYHKDGLAGTCNYHPETLEDKGLNLFFVRSMWTYDNIISVNSKNKSQSKSKQNKTKYAAMTEDEKFFHIMFDVPYHFTFSMQNNNEFNEFSKRYLKNHFGDSIFKKVINIDNIDYYYKKIEKEYEDVFTVYSPHLCPTLSSYENKSKKKDLLKRIIEQNVKTLLMGVHHNEN